MTRASIGVTLVFMRRSLAPAILMVSLVGASLARADAIEPPSGPCPEGTGPYVSHCPSCVPDVCVSDADCDPDQRCEERSYCTIVYRSCGGWGGGGSTDARPACATSSDCDAAHPCTAHRVCVGGARPRDAGSASRLDASPDASGIDAGDGRVIVRYGCGCHASSASPAPLASLALLALAWARQRRAGARRARAAAPARRR